jgi:DNA-binding CsgD family transcriptional regulator
MSSAKQRDNGGPTPHGEWQRHATWALRLVHELAQDPARRPPLRMQKFVDALARQFEASATLSIRGPERAAVAQEITRVQSGRESTVTSPATHRLVDSLDLPSSNRATVTLQRPATSPTFSQVERAWVQILHVGCSWLYASGSPGSTPRLADLSPREREALGYLLRGASEKEVALSLGRSRHTVHSYVKRIYRTLGVRSRSELRAVFRDANGGASLLRGVDAVTTSDE